MKKPFVILGYLTSLTPMIANSAFAALSVTAKRVQLEAMIKSRTVSTEFRQMLVDFLSDKRITSEDLKRLGKVIESADSEVQRIFVESMFEGKPMESLESVTDVAENLLSSSMGSAFRKVFIWRVVDALASSTRESLEKNIDPALEIIMKSPNVILQESSSARPYSTGRGSRDPSANLLDTLISVLRKIVLNRGISESSIEKAAKILDVIDLPRGSEACSRAYSEPTSDNELLKKSGWSALHTALKKKSESDDGGKGWAVNVDTSKGY